jgi:hypothetical protein
MNFNHIELGDTGSGITHDGYCFDEIEIEGFNHEYDEKITKIAVITGILYNPEGKEPRIVIKVIFNFPEFKEHERVKVLLEEGKEEIINSLRNLQEIDGE